MTLVVFICVNAFVVSVTALFVTDWKPVLLVWMLLAPWVYALLGCMAPNQ